MNMNTTGILNGGNVSGTITLSSSYPITNCTIGPIISSGKMMSDGVAVATISDINDIKSRLESIENRLGILVPNQEALDKYESLQDLYSKYKMMEALLLKDM